MNLELFRVRDILSQRPVTVNLNDSVSQMAELLLSCNHGGFPVTKTTEAGDVFFGFIKRSVADEPLLISEMMMRMHL